MVRALGLNGPLQPAATEEQAHAEMRAAGRMFGRKVLATAEPDPPPVGMAKRDTSALAECINARAAWWSKRLRNQELNPRLTERLVTTFVTAAHEASRARLDEAGES